jgi:hypothetical protein
MLSWAVLINNLGRRRYPLHWWHPDSQFVRTVAEREEVKEESDLAKIEEGQQTTPEEAKSSELQE